MWYLNWYRAGGDTVTQTIEKLVFSGEELRVLTSPVIQSYVRTDEPTKESKVLTSSLTESYIKSEETEESSIEIEKIIETKVILEKCP